MESEMVQNSTSNFSITFNKYDQIQDHVFIKINKCDLIQPKKFNQLQRKVKNRSQSTKKIDQIQQFAISENHSQEERKSLSTNPKILYEVRLGRHCFFKMADGDSSQRMGVVFYLSPFHT